MRYFHEYTTGKERRYRRCISRQLHYLCMTVGSQCLGGPCPPCFAHAFCCCLKKNLNAARGVAADSPESTAAPSSNHSQQTSAIENNNTDLRIGLLHLVTYQGRGRGGVIMSANIVVVPMHLVQAWTSAVCRSHNYSPLTGGCSEGLDAVQIFL